MGRRSRMKVDTPVADASGSPGMLPVIDIVGLALIALRWFTPTEGTFRGDTLWISQAWLGWGVLAAWSAMRQGDRWRRRWGLWEIGLVLLVLGHVVAALAVVATEGQKRAALNGMWEWISLGLAAVWFQHRASSAAFRRTFRIALISSALGLSALGVWQRWVAQPQLGRAVTEYDELEAKLPSLEGIPRRDAESRLRTLRQTVGTEYTSLDDAGRRAMRQRLIESSEPIARFALANSFAAILLVSLFLAVGETAASWRARTAAGATPMQTSALVRGLAIALVLFIAFVLLLTKSRTAFAGAAAGGVIATVLEFRGRVRAALFAGVLALGTAGMLAAVTWAAGGLDRLVVTEAPKSLEYRMEYWIGTWKVIQDHPWLGVGSGNFRQHYLTHKLAKSSEEVLDPHDFLLEAWVTGGLTALLGLLGVGLAYLLSCRRGATEEFPAKVAGVNWLSSAPPLLFTAAIVLLFKEWLLDGFADGELVLIAGLSVVTGMGLNRVFAPDETTHSENLVETAVQAAWFALSVHLLGAGGMEMPAVIQLWLCLSSLMVASRRPATTKFWPGRTPGIAAAACVAAFCGHLVTATAPSLGARGLVDLAEAEMTLNAPSVKVDERLQEAAAHDRFDPEPWRRRAQYAFVQWQQTRSDEWFDRAVAAQREAIARDPLHAHDHRALADVSLRRFAFDRRPADAAAAVEAVERALELYPNSIAARRVMAEALSAAGRRDEAVSAAKRTLELDELYLKLGHYDKALTFAERDRMRELADAK
jgi:hypothetical protein